MGRRWVDQRQPASHVARPTVASSRVTIRALPRGNARTSSGSAKALAWSRGMGRCGRRQIQGQPKVMTRTGMSEIAACVVPLKLQTLNVTWPFEGTRWP